jgi:hypothetical protein
LIERGACPKLLRRIERGVPKVAYLIERGTLQTGRFGDETDPLAVVQFLLNIFE